MDNLPQKIYSSKGKKGMSGVVRQLIADFPAAHSLGFRFAERNLRAKYRQSLFGIVWAFFPPLATAAIWIILNASGIVRLAPAHSPGSYPLFVITGTLLWSVFSSSVLMPLQMVQSNRAILVKINFPREALMVSAFYEILFNACIVLCIIVIELIVFRVPLSLESLLFIPSVGVIILMGMSVGMLLLPVALLYRDVQFMMPSFLQFAMYLTPVIYAKPVYEGFSEILRLNPVTPLLTSARSWLLGTDQAASPVMVLAIASGSVILFLAGWIIQKVTLRVQIERMGS